jgi:hypothetical protein
MIPRAPHLVLWYCTPRKQSRNAAPEPMSVRLVSVCVEEGPSVPFCLMKACIASLAVYRTPCKFTSTVFRLGGFEEYSGPVNCGVSLSGYIVGEE